MKVLIIEDEPIAAQRLAGLLKEINPAVEVVRHLDSVEASIRFLQERPQLDLAFVDIELGDGQSFEIFQNAEVEAPVIFITAYRQHALKAFKLNSIDYLLKPLNKAELEKAVEKFEKIHARKNSLPGNIAGLLRGLVAEARPPAKQRFLAKSGTRLVSVAAAQVAFFYTKDKLQFVKTVVNEDFMIDKRLDELEAEVDPKNFFRANRQFILSYGSIERVHAWFSGKLKVQVRPASYEEIVISRLRAADFKLWLGE